MRIDRPRASLYWGAGGGGSAEGSIIKYKVAVKCLKLGTIRSIRSGSLL
jgi:hypothetical protein